ncbi:MAG: hypothetical protein JXB34_06845 [Bacteroidales bacterium]|nr:hypothetical protein [Bacteroidales bacterium]
MAKYLFVVPPFYGHITATLGVGAELLRRGNMVYWVGLKEIGEGYLPEGGVFIVPEEVEKHRDQINEILLKQDAGTSIKGADALDFEMDVTAMPFARIMFEGLINTIRDIKPDCIIHDESALAGPICAELENIPYATSITVPPGYFDPDLFFPEQKKAIFKRMMNFQKEFGVRTSRLVFNSDKLVLSYTSTELLSLYYGNFTFPQQFKFVGSTVEGRPCPVGFDWARLHRPATKIIYVSIGTVLNDIKSAIFTKIVEALKDKNFTVVANTDPGLFAEWPSNFIVQKTCPQLELIRKSDLVITHGGFNTINEALYFNKPMILMPLAWDQFTNADMVVHQGAGIKLKYRRIHSTDIFNAVQTILKDNTYYKSAEKLGCSLRAGGGSQRAASLIENLIVKTNK